MVGRFGLVVASQQVLEFFDAAVVIQALVGCDEVANDLLGEGVGLARCLEQRFQKRTQIGVGFFESTLCDETSTECGFRLVYFGVVVGNQPAETFQC